MLPIYTFVQQIQKTFLHGIMVNSKVLNTFILYQDCEDGYTPDSESPPRPACSERLSPIHHHSDETTSDEGSSNSDRPGSSDRKRVRFKSGPSLNEVHRMVAWDYAYRRARAGPWHRMTVDDCRFKDRIRSVEPTLTKILEPSHRQKIFDLRFSESCWSRGS
jgi:hypothetical protein